MNVEETVACPSCGRQVDNPLAHEGYSCANWPTDEDCDKVFLNPGPDHYTTYVEYRDYQIGYALVGSGFEWVHKDYDGPEDSRAGTSHSVQGCCMDIDEKEDL